MLRRLLSTTALFLLALATSAQAALRSPQIAVSGTALQAFFTSQGQAINVNTDQLDLETMSFAANATISMGLSSPNNAGATVGLYNAGFAVPPLYQIFPGAAVSGWFAQASFRTAPTRVVVSLFDASSAFQGSITYLAGPPDRTFMGLYVQQSGGTVSYTQDARNAGGEARILAYAATGANEGLTWFACEFGPTAGGDFADFITLVNLTGAPVPVSHTNWGTLKQRFR